MKICFSPILMLFCLLAASQEQTYVGSTPAHSVVRTFLGISLTDSIDFIRWKVELAPNKFTLQCQYGLAKAGTPGFVHEKRVAYEGKSTKTANLYSLEHSGRSLFLLKVNADLLHLLDNGKHMLVGNGGYSYALNSTTPRITDQFGLPPVQQAVKYPLVFEGRTPCQELSALLNLHKSQACNKMKWYIVFYGDSLGQPTYYLKGRKEAMEKGKWQIINTNDGRIIYKLTPDAGTYTLHLLKGDENILFFIRPDGRLLVGNEDFSYTLNRRKAAHTPAKR